LYGLFRVKKFIYTCPIFNECGDTAVCMLRIKGLTKGTKERQMTY